MVNWVVGIPIGSPKMKAIGTLRGTPNHQLTISWIKSWEKNMMNEWLLPLTFQAKSMLSNGNTLENLRWILKMMVLNIHFLSNLVKFHRCSSQLATNMYSKLPLLFVPPFPLWVPSTQWRIISPRMQLIARFLRIILMLAWKNTSQEDQSASFEIPTTHGHSEALTFTQLKSCAGPWSGMD